ncbi:MAG: MarR family transcriptional regulator [Chloroflexi bacterium]|nr:MarR family transcriptional regulator [Chloroflexota bacterium]
MPESTISAGEGPTWEAYRLLGRYIIAVRTAMQRSADRQKAGGHAPHHVHALIYLFEHEGATIGDLAAALGVTRGRGTRLADELVQAGMLARARDDLDGRVIRLRLTPRAHQAAHRVFAHYGETVAHALEGLTPGEVGAVLRFLTRLCEAHEVLARE